MKLSPISVTDSSWRRAYLFFLAMLLLALPLSEAIKQISIVATILSGAGYLYAGRIALRRDAAFWGAVGLSVASLLSVAVAQDQIEALQGALDILKIMLLFLIVREIRLRDREILTLFLLLFLSFAVALVWGEYLYLNGLKHYLQLKSVGHVNHSAIYMGIVTLCAYGLFYYERPALEGGRRIKWVAALMLLAGTFALVTAGSRAAVLGTFLPILATFLMTGSYRHRNLLLLMGAVAVVFTLTLGLHGYSIQKLHQGLEDSGRFLLWHASLLAYFDHNLLLGMGSKNFHFIELSRYMDSAPWKHISHAHNTYVTFLLEKGAAGLLCYLLFLFGLIKALLKSNAARYLKIIAWNVLALNLIVSLVNTTFHDENGLLMGILWALALQKKSE